MRKYLAVFLGVGLLVVSFGEAIMRMFAYPGMEEHQKEHQLFFARLDSIERHSLKKSADVEMIQFLRSWLTTHILGSDRGYAHHIFFWGTGC